MCGKNADTLQTLITTPTPLFEPFYAMGIFGYIWDIMGDIIRIGRYSPMRVIFCYW